MIAYTYILECSDGTLYTGWTKDLAKRMTAHNSGCGAKYTRSRTPVHLRYVEEFDSEHAARSREWHIKQLSRREKLELIRNWRKIS